MEVEDVEGRKGRVAERRIAGEEGVEAEKTSAKSAMATSYANNYLISSAGTVKDRPYRRVAQQNRGLEAALVGVL